MTDPNHCGNSPGCGISARQLGALALTTAGLPIFRLCCRISWSWVLLGGLAAAGTLSALTAVINRHRAKAGRCPSAKPPKGMACASEHSSPALHAGPHRGPGAERACTGADEVASDQRTGQRFLWALAPFLLTGAVITAWETTYSFPETAGNLLAAALVLALSAAAAYSGPAAAGRCASILLWVTGALYGTVLLFSLRSLRTQWLVPAGEPLDALKVWAALTLPGAALCLAPALQSKQRLPHWPWWAAAGLAAAASAVTGGILSPALAREPEAFRTLATGVSVLGVVRRFEALVNGAMLMSGFALCALYLVAFAELLSISGDRKKARKKLRKSQKKC